jgi:hypothetical protein
MPLEEFQIHTENSSAKFVPKVSLHEYFIDLLGGLVPGVLFLIGNLFLILSVIFVLSNIMNNDKPDSFGFFINSGIEAIKGTPSTFWLLIFMISFFFAYTVGHIFYRHDPKIPDMVSIKRLEKKLRLEGKDDDAIIAQLACITSDEESCQFPYSSYHEYLSQKKLEYLSKFVLWNTNRSKSYINILKTRLMYYHADKCGTIIRNEAHVRLASSTWYVSRFLFYAGIISLIIQGILIVISNVAVSPGNSMNLFIAPLIISVIVILFAFYFYRNIPEFMHYQRLREVFYVLDTYCIAFKEEPDKMKVPLNKFMDSIVDEYKRMNINTKIEKEHCL